VVSILVSNFAFTLPNSGLIRLYSTVWDEEFRLKLYEEEGKLEGQRLTIKMMRKEGSRAKDEELIGEGSVLVDGKSWIEFDGEYLTDLPGEAPAKESVVR
jgi:hypothetical protein